MSAPDLRLGTLFDVHGKTVLITGGGGGLGLMMSAAFVQNGAKVYIASRKKDQLEASVKELNALGKASGGSAAYIVADLKDKAGCEAVARALKTKETKLHVLINNTGMSWGGALDDFPEVEGWDRVLGTNVKSIFYMTTLLLPLLVAGASSTAPIQPASVINISSINGSMAVSDNPLSQPGWGSYSYATSKAAANHLTRVLALALAGRGINVNAIAPGVYPSKMTAYGIKTAEKALLELQPNGRLGTTEDIAGLALFLASRAGAHVTGAVIPTDGGASLSLGAKVQQPALAKL